jgi:Family of unknown function (DUF6266)
LRKPDQHYSKTKNDTMPIISKKNLSRNSIGVITQLLATINGIESLRKKKYKRTAPASEAQLAQQQKIKVVTDFLKSMTPFLNEGFGHLAKRNSAWNVANSYTNKNTLIGVYPNISISYPEVLISKGDMHNVIPPSVTIAAGGEMLISWEDNSGIGAAKATDRVLLAAYCPALNQTICTAGNATRSELSANLNLSAFKGNKVHVYIGLVSVNGKDVASSLYLGELEVL